jgi:hypothetical protein
METVCVASRLIVQCNKDVLTALVPLIETGRVAQRPDVEKILSATKYLVHAVLVTLARVALVVTIVTSGAVTHLGKTGKVVKRGDPLETEPAMVATKSSPTNTTFGSWSEFSCLLSY